MELLIVIAIIGILAMIVLLALRPGPQIAKARDARRKGDMAKVQRCLEEYNNDHGYYLPASSYSCGGSSLSPCVATIPCDPFKNVSYEYETDGTATPGWYRLYTKLDYTSDPSIAQVGCGNGCIVVGATYNYFVSSPNAPAIVTPSPTPGGGATPTPTLTPAPTPVCQAPICGQPQYYVGLCGSCCNGGKVRLKQIGGSYYCCPDSSCP